jgi:hypothetical protein
VLEEPVSIDSLDELSPAWFTADSARQLLDGLEVKLGIPGLVEERVPVAGDVTAAGEPPD